MKERQRWLVLEDDDCIHVVPETDSKPHGFPKDGIAKLCDLDCPCKPKVNMGGRKPTVTHNSFDDMNRIEESMQKLSK